MCLKNLSAKNISVSLYDLISQIDNPENVRLVLDNFESQFKKLKRRVSTLEAEQAKKAQLCFKFEDQLLKFKNMLFGKSSEKRNLSVRYRKKREKKICLEGERLVPSPKEEEMKEVLEVECTHRLTKEKLGDIAVEHGYPRESEWRELKIYDKSSRIHINPQKVIKEVNQAVKYVLVESEKSQDKTIMVSKERPKGIVPSSSYSPRFAVEVLSSKYLYHLPLERIRRMFESQGLKIQTKTLYNLCYFVSMYLEKVVERIKEEIRSSDRTVHIDENPWGRQA